MIDLTIVTASWWVYAGAAALCVVVSTRAVRITGSLVGLGILLSQQALATLAAVLAFSARSPAVADLAFRGGAVLWVLWSPAVALAAALLLEQTRQARVARVAAVVTGAPNLLLLAAAMVEPSLLFDASGRAVTPLAAAAISLVFVTLSWATLLLTREALSTPLPLQRVQLSLLAVAFAVEGSFHAFQNTPKVLFEMDLHGFGEAGPLFTAILLVPSIVLLPTAGWVITRAANTRSRSRARWAWGIAAALGFSGATGALTAPLAAGDEFRDPVGMFHAFWDLFALLLLVYAAHRFQLVALEERAKQGIAISFLVACGFVIFGVVQALMERTLQERYLAGLPSSDILAALAVAVTSMPVAKIGNHLARRLFPPALVVPGSERRRNEEIYEAAVEGTLLDGHASPAEARSLASLRQRLGVTEADHARIEQRVRAQLTVKAAVSPA